MINIFYRMNKELASWMSIWRFLRGLDRDALSNGPADSGKNKQVKWEFERTQRRSLEHGLPPAGHVPSFPASKGARTGR